MYTENCTIMEMPIGHTRARKTSEVYRARKVCTVKEKTLDLKIFIRIG